VSDSAIDSVEEVLLRSRASCVEGIAPKGMGEICLTPSKIVWLSIRDLSNLPFSLRSASVTIPITEIESVSALSWLPTRPLRVRSTQGLFGFTFHAGSRVNPLVILRSRKLSIVWSKAIAERLID
jgi:hypothetical protein